VFKDAESSHGPCVPTPIPCTCPVCTVAGHDTVTSLLLQGKIAYTRHLADTNVRLGLGNTSEVLKYLGNAVGAWSVTMHKLKLTQRRGSKVGVMPHCTFTSTATWRAMVYTPRFQPVDGHFVEFYNMLLQARELSRLVRLATCAYWASALCCCTQDDVQWPVAILQCMHLAVLIYIARMLV
jgi:hypothetical protein